MPFHGNVRRCREQRNVARCWQARRPKTEKDLVGLVRVQVYEQCVRVLLVNERLESLPRQVRDVKKRLDGEAFAVVDAEVERRVVGYASVVVNTVQCEGVSFGSVSRKAQQADTAAKDDCRYEWNVDFAHNFT